MKTITIQIGNSDDKLPQARWARFVEDIAVIISYRHCRIHFFACSAGGELWQNAAWVVVCSAEEAALLKAAITEMRGAYDQDSVAWTEGETQFV